MRRRIVPQEPRRTLGSLLHASDRAEVLRSFVHRFTMDHVPAWARKVRSDGTYTADDVQAFAGRLADYAEGQLKGKRGFTSDKSLQRLVNQRVLMFGEKPDDIMGLIQSAGKNAKTLAVNLEASTALGIKMTDETRHRYALFYQYTHLTREKDSLAHDDRLDSFAGACGYFAPMLGVNPLGMAQKKQEERIEEELEELFNEAEDVARYGRKNPIRGFGDRFRAAPGRAH